MSSGRNKNYKIGKSTSSVTTTTAIKEHCYKYIDFAKTEIIVTEGLPEDDDGITNDNKKTDIKNIMLGKNTIIRMHTIGEQGYNAPSGTSTTDKLKQDIEITLNDDKYKDMPCGIQTTQGSIISLPIVLHDQTRFYDNGLNVSGASSQKSNKIDWDVVDVSNPTDRAYGYKTHDKYVTNKNTRGYVNDEHAIIQNRSYTYEVDDNNKDIYKGSFIFCYDVSESSEKSQGTTALQQNRIPKLNVQIGRTSGSALNIDIPPTGQMTALYKGQSVSGGMSAVETDFLPVQCRRTAGCPIKALFIYPIYSGVVITNGINKNMQQGGGEIFIKFAKNSAPNQNVQINGSIDKDIEDLMGNDNDNMEIKWFPAVHQQTTNKDDIHLTVDVKQEIKFSGKITVNWIKTLGSFAYCPLFFYNKLYFDLYFKGSYDVKAETDSSTISQKTAYTYDIYPVLIGDRIQGNSYKSIGATKFYSDNTLNQTIYRAKFTLKSKEISHYPMQVFGAVVAGYKTAKTFDVDNSDGTFSIEGYNNWCDNIISCNISCGLQGLSGSITIDTYKLSDSMKTDVDKLDYNVGEIKLTMEECGVINTSHPILFRGIGYELSKSNNENSNQYVINVVGMQKKLQDMKLICAPFWDGDQLSEISKYMEAYTAVPIKMVSKPTGTKQSAANTTSFPFISSSFGVNESWKATPPSLTAAITSEKFRVPCSTNWESPAIDFPTGTSCLQALKTLAQKTSCFFTVGMDGYGYFYELNDYGVPFYADTGARITIAENEIINFSLQPALDNKHNSIATMGFLQKRFSNGKTNTSTLIGSVVPGSYYTKLKSAEQGNITIPWSRTKVTVQSGYLTKSELLIAHEKNLIFSRSSIYQGSVTVLGNTKVNHIYQSIEVGGETFFVISIQHNIDMSSKLWTTTYGIQKMDKIKEQE